MMMHMHHKDDIPGLRTSQVWILALSAGVMVANIYYIQPLLAAMAADFHVSVASIGVVAMARQVGTAIAMFLLAALGGDQERRGLIIRLVLSSAAFLVLLATSRNFVWLALTSFGVGLTGSIVHVI